MFSHTIKPEGQAETMAQWVHTLGFKTTIEQWNAVLLPLLHLTHHTIKVLFFDRFHQQDKQN